MSGRAPRRCRRCHLPVLYWRNANREDSYLKVDPSFDERGTVQKIVNRDSITGQPTVWGRRLTGRDLEDAIANGERLHQLHSQTCTANRTPNPRPDGLSWPPTTKDRR
ncbi:hypothetical protein [Gordonia sp. NB41Y]|uniref:hypothetical protein n=1 Tax=Gordonia sp. NB41Y TaxID=875808 RepID=UPI0002BF8D38|nr:hypothetical protein [Gordonia sp. NB41Y]EMP15073.1 hypothetical protein ISGA_50 [Gordonia sp. NB41Y]WLP91341.1 hypothetical protein Q9K23_03455 [Gordonia sp. NB41Y]